jgi:hypothetical protein
MKKNFNYKVVWLLEIYNFGFGHLSIWGHLKNSNFIMLHLFLDTALDPATSINRFLGAAPFLEAAKNSSHLY